MSKTFKRSIVLLVMIAMIVSACAVFAGCKVVSDDSIDNTPVYVNMADDFYVGNSTGSYDLGSKFPGATMALNGIATLNGTRMDFTGVGKVEINVGVAKKNIYVIDGVNVADEAGFRAALNSAKNVVMQGDITFVAGGSSMNLKASIYGNGNGLYLKELIKPVLKGNGKFKETGSSAFYIDAAGGTFTNEIMINGVRMNGQVFEADAKEGLAMNEGAGSFVSLAGNDTYTPKVSAYNCVFENAHKIFFFKSSILNVEACIFKNASDNVLCLETTNTKGAVLNIKNTAIINSLDAAILFCGWTKTNSEDDFCSINIDGFLDIYNWKSTKTAKLMPNTEQWAGTVNGLVQSQMKNKSYQKFLCKDSGGNTYLHSGIIAIATGDLKKNTPKINDTVMNQDNIDTSKNGSGKWDKLDNKKLLEMKYELRGFPIPSAAKLIAKTCIIIGYGNTESAKNAPIKPDTKFSANAKKLMDTELRNGRAAV